MLEGIIALGIFALYAIGALLFAFLDWEHALWGGLGSIALGLVFGTPGSIFYHVQLKRVLRARGPVPPGWYWHPTQYHATFNADERRAVQPSFVAGVVGFLALLGGCALLVLASFQMNR